LSESASTTGSHNSLIAPFWIENSAATGQVYSQIEEIEIEICSRLNSKRIHLMYSFMDDALFGDLIVL
jgi:hypothetical protein